MFPNYISSNIAAAILAGGKNSRMGGINKSLIKLQGIPIMQRTINTLKEIFEETFIIANDPEDYKKYKKDCWVILDKIKNIGPLGGIFSALSETTKEAVFFVACDMPFLHNGIIWQQISRFNELNCDVIVPRISAFIEPLHAVYKRSLKDNIYNFLKDNRAYSVRSFLRTVNVYPVRRPGSPERRWSKKQPCNGVYYWDLEDNFFHKNIFKNLNTQADLTEIKEYAGKIKSLA